MQILMLMKCNNLLQIQSSLVTKNLRKVYKRGDKGKGTHKKGERAAVRNMTFRVKPGEVFGLLGPNGAGKSTTLNMLTAEVPPSAGSVIIPFM